MSRIIVLDPPL